MGWEYAHLQCMTSSVKWQNAWWGEVGLGIPSPSVLEPNLQCQPVGVTTREECHWPHACPLQAEQREEPMVSSSVNFCPEKRAPCHRNRQLPRPPLHAPSVFGHNLQSQPVRAVITREECHWSHAWQRFKQAGVGTMASSSVNSSQKKRTVHHQRRWDA